MASQPTPPNVPPPEIAGLIKGLLTIKPLFLWGVTKGLLTIKPLFLWGVTLGEGWLTSHD